MQYNYRIGIIQYKDCLVKKCCKYITNQWDNIVKYSDSNTLKLNLEFRIMHIIILI